MSLASPTRRPAFRLSELAAACGLLCAASPAAWAQQAPPPAGAQQAQTITVTGIRRSLQSSLETKRDGQGVVDGIVAEDIGKFPDTNLAESMQRITGVSIDRVNGEGSRITVRGLGPDFNLVLLNGRQMPTARLDDTGASNSRAFDFANLASESVAAVEVYKTTRAGLSSGGIGAMINIKTARPLDNPGRRASFGIKGVHDESNERLPDVMQGKSITPEVSGIYSETFAGGKFGIAITGSYQERESGYNQASVPGGWRSFRGDENNWGTIPQAGTPGSERITNRPGPNDIYSVPQNLNYSVTGIQRKRTNGQLVLQFAPTDNLKATLDFTYSENKIHTRRSDLSAWFNFGPSSSTWGNGPVAAPLVYSEIINPTADPSDDPFNGLSDIAMGSARFGVKNQNKSTGLNLAWKVSDRLSVALDAHHSTAVAGKDSPYGSNAVLGGAQYTRGTTTADFRNDFPVLVIDSIPVAASRMLATGSSFRNSYMLSEIDQLQISGKFDLADASRLNFGVAATNAHNRSAYSNVQRDTWGGAGTAANYPDSAYTLQQVRPLFNKISGSGDPRLFNQFFISDFETVRAAAAAATNDPAGYLASDVFSTDRRVKEKSTSAFLQYDRNFALALPVQVAAGLRYEKTDVTSSALVPIATGYSWVGANEFSVQFGAPGFTTLHGSYSYVLPSLDVEVDLRSDMKLRASYGESIGRPGWGDIQGGQTLNQLGRIDRGIGAQGNPALKPLKSKNFDLSFEYYYARGSYASVGAFHKDIDNYVGVTTVEQTPFNLPTPAGGALYNEAVANGCAVSDNPCIRQSIFSRYGGTRGITGPTVANPTATIVIPGQPGDPIAKFNITIPANQRSATLKGLELAVQHAFGNSGFGVSANYTIVRSNLKYDNAKLNDQFAIEGLSDSANLVGFYEDDRFSVRAAYNWRDKFLSGRFDGSGGPQPVYTEAYGQWDLTLGYKLNDKVSFAAEVINLNDGVQRLHGRTKEQVLFATQTGRRYMLGARYTF